MTDGKAEFKIGFWGVRGSIAAPGPDYVKYGGNTSCVEIRCGNQLFIVDGGTGIRPLGVELFKEAPLEATVLFSHYHWDHIGGVPFFGPFFDPRNKFEIYGEARGNKKLKAILSGQMKYPYFPVPIAAFNAKLDFHTIEAGHTIDKGDVKIKTAPLNHPQTAMAYRFEYKGKSAVYCSDNEHGEKVPAKLAKLIKGTDILIYDAAYTEDEYHGLVGGPPKVGWGHSTWTAAIRTARELDVKDLYIFHHDPMHNDDKVDELLMQARKEFKNVHASREGLVVKLA